MNTQSQAPNDGPSAVPSVARMYDYFLGGHHNFPADRAAAEQVIAIHPDFPQIMQANRAFLRRAVRFLLAQGITQFLDLGSGIPTVGNVHEVAQQTNPGAHVVYVDSDPVAVTHSAALLTENPHATIIQADARQPEQILSHAEARRLLDFSQPIGLLLVAFLHFVTDDAEVIGLVRGLHDTVAPGSYIAISHATSEFISRDLAEQGVEVYRRSSNPVKPRARVEIARFFEGFELVEPGLVATPLWRPEGPDDVFLDEPQRSVAVAGVGRKP